MVFYVYLLESNSSLGKRYVGVTADLKRRLHEHNSGKSIHTSKFVPWRVVTYVAFSNRPAAERSNVISSPDRVTRLQTSAYGAVVVE